METAQWKALIVPGGGDGDSDGVGDGVGVGVDDGDGDGDGAILACVAVTSVSMVRSRLVRKPKQERWLIQQQPRRLCSLWPQAKLTLGIVMRAARENLPMVNGEREWRDEGKKGERDTGDRSSRSLTGVKGFGETIVVDPEGGVSSNHHPRKLHSKTQEGQPPC
ncbi:hypothetical protein HZH66_010023 [Vespula vulgaris]|uniref:Uncharacterized protein n=1 Tax=Vespula vulgaris TaxID=7454 RepID=A0A834JJV0_VESVU|nr:hypothetical protein HZH66_010023 [Vespula vulgaris]